MIDERDEREKERLERKLQALHAEVQRLIAAYQASVIDLPELQTRRQRVEDHGTALRARLREINAQRESREPQLRVVQGIDEFCASLRTALQDPSDVVKQKVLQLVVDRIVVDEHQLTIRHVVPTGPVRLQTRPPGANTRAKAPGVATSWPKRNLAFSIASSVRSAVGVIATGNPWRKSSRRDPTRDS
jgi:site-specific DNA recombinase